MPNGLVIRFFVISISMILLNMLSCGLNEIDTEKSITVLSETNNPISNCMLRLFVNNQNFDFLSNDVGQIKFKKDSIGSVNEVDAFFVANGYVCKKIKLNITSSKADTFFLKKVILDIADTAFIFIASVPPLAFILKDSLCIGKTNIALLHLNSGKHSLMFVKRNCNDSLYELDLIRGENPSMMVRLSSK